MKALWKGNISFALVSVPVKLYGATQKKDVRFHMLHKKCSTPLSYERHCSSCNVIVPWEEAVHGYEYRKGKFVVVADEEIDALPLKTARSIDIQKFVDERQIDPIYYDRAYYLEPEEGAERAYALLRETIKAHEKAALSKIAFREKEHIAVIRVFGGVLSLHTLLYADEILKPEALNVPGKMDLDGKELSLAEQLVKHFTGKFDPALYHDEFRDALTKMINAKIEGREIKVPPKKEAAKVVSLMDALKKSLKEKEKPEKAERPEKKRKAG